MKLSWRSLFLVAVLALVLWVGYLARAVVTPLLGALLLAYVFDPVVTWMQRRGLSRNAASGLLVFVAFTGVVGVAGWGGTRIAQEASRFYDDVVGEPLADAGLTEAEAVRALGPKDGPPAVVVRTGYRGADRWFVDTDGDGRFREGLARRTSAAVEETLSRSPWTQRFAKRAAEAADVPPMLLSSAGPRRGRRSRRSRSSSSSRSTCTTRS